MEERLGRCGKMDLRPTKKKVLYSFIISALVSMMFFTIRATTTKSASGYLSPEEFHIYYIVSILSFLAAYFTFCWLIVEKDKSSLLDILKDQRYKK